MTPDDKPPRAGTLGDRNEGNIRRVTPALGVPVRDDLTPPPMDLPDEVEIKANKIQRRAETIEHRPGPTPDSAAMHTALTIFGVRTELKAELAEVKSDVREVKKDVRDLVPKLLDVIAGDREATRRDRGAELEAELTITTKRATTAIEDAAAVKQAERARVSSNRETRNKIIAGVFGGGIGVGTIIEVLHRLFG